MGTKTKELRDRLDYSGVNAKQKKAIRQTVDEPTFSDLPPQVLTDKDEFKVLPCRECKRAVIVTRFAAPGKTACNDCRSKPEPTKVREFDESKDEHVLTDKDQTKRVPCAVCGRPCIVTTFATPEKVRCNDHRAARARTTVKVEKVDGHYTATTQVEQVSEHDLAWSAWTLAMPILEVEWTKDDAKLRDELWAKHRQAITDHHDAKKARLEAEDKLARAKKKDEDAAAKALSEADQVEVAAKDRVAILRSERDALYRRAYVRTLLGSGYSFKDGTLHRGQEPVATPPDDWMEKSELDALVKEAA